MAKEQGILCVLQDLVHSVQLIEVRQAQEAWLTPGGQVSAGARLLIDVQGLVMPIESEREVFSEGQRQCFYIPPGLRFTHDSLKGVGLLFEFAKNHVYLTLIEDGRAQSMNYELVPFMKIHGQLSALMEIFTESFTNENDLSICERSALLKLLLTRTFSCSEMQIDNYTGDRDRVNFLNISTYIADNHQRVIKQAELAEVMGLSVQHLNRICHKISGLSLHKYMNAIKMESLRKILSVESLTNQDLATRTGFKDVNYMGQAFKKFYGVTPFRFKNSHVSEEHTYAEVCAYNWTNNFSFLQASEEILNSAEESEALSSYIYNGLDEQLECLWLDDKGREVSLFKVLPQQRIGLFTPNGQTFMMRSLAGELISSYRIKLENVLMIVHRDFDRRQRCAQGKDLERS